MTKEYVVEVQDEYKSGSFNREDTSLLKTKGDTLTQALSELGTVTIVKVYGEI